MCLDNARNECEHECEHDFTLFEFLSSLYASFNELKNRRRLRQIN